ncbi:MFS transporter [Halopseudomonas sp. SMJS2]|uniref:MFS transporter n=1 Tax=Halopseudomonas sp. SMJS2 TaxID=3041098 RepID=UPI002452FFFF|nr:MFS transporter [Halopseudomonas sp. SMJS2]WGK63267.1 MFS transporter [Halopseudomonas sp. SMJS2]
MAEMLPYWRLSGFYFCYFALLGGVAPFLSLYFHHLGFSAARIGELVAIPMLMRCFAPVLWGWLGDRSGQRLLIVRLGALLTALTFTGILWRQDYLWLALIMALHSFFWHVVLPQFETITFGHLGEQSARYSRIRLWGSVGFIVTVVVLGLLLDRFSPAIYPQAMLSIMLAIFCCSLLVPPAPVAATRSALPGDGFLRQLWRPGVLVFFFSAGLMQLSHGPYYTFLTLHLEALGYDRVLIGAMWALGVVAEIILFMVMSVILARFSLKQLLIGSFILAALRWLLLGFWADSLVLLALAQVMHAATFGCFHVVAVHFVQRSFAERYQGQGQALYATLSGCGGALGALYSGYSWNALGAGWTFALASVAATLAALLLLRWMPGRAS